MSDIKIQPSATGSGTVTITAPTTNTARVITLPDSAGTLLDENSSVPSANLTGTVVDARISALTASKLTGDLPAIIGVNVTNVHAVNSGRKNMVINGAMKVAQRGPSFTGNTSGNRFTADRFKAQIGSAGTFTFDNSSTAPEGFSNSSHMNCTTAFSVASGTYLLFSQDFEGQDLQQAAYGTASAKQMTVSFWCRATKTGSLSVVIRQEDASQRMFSKNVTINTANTWEKKSVVIPADTGGTINNDSGKGLQIAWWVNGGSTYGGGSEQTTWGAQTHTNKYTGTLNIGASTADNFYLTGVQLELGSTATNFEHRSFGEELALCQRYYEIVADNSESTNTDVCYVGGGYSYKSDQINWHYTFAVKKRASFTLEATTGTNYYKASLHGETILDTAVGMTAAYQPLNGVHGYITGSYSGSTIGKAWLFMLNVSGAKIAVSAEL